MSQNIFSALRYRDAPAAIEWLERAFGFERLAVHPGPDGTVAHAELVLDGGVLMLGSVKPDAYGARSPREVGEISQSLYVWVLTSTPIMPGRRPPGRKCSVGRRTPSTARASTVAVIRKGMFGALVLIDPKRGRECRICCARLLLSAAGAPA